MLHVIEIRYVSQTEIDKHHVYVLWFLIFKPLVYTLYKATGFSFSLPLKKRLPTKLKN